MFARALAITTLSLVTIGVGVRVAQPAAVAESPPAVSPSAAAPVARWPTVMSTGMRSSDLDQSIRFYTQGLGMTLLTKRVSGPVTEVIFGFGTGGDGAGLMVFQKKGDGQSTPVDHGNSDTKVVLGVSDIAVTAARLKTAGYPVGEIAEHGPYKVLWAKDPDGYQYEIVETPQSREAH
jgi:lactoylglutathione lyase